MCGAVQHCVSVQHAADQQHGVSRLQLVLLLVQQCSTLLRSSRCSFQQEVLRVLCSLTDIAELGVAVPRNPATPWGTITTAAVGDAWILAWVAWVSGKTLIQSDYGAIGTCKSLHNIMLASCMQSLMWVHTITALAMRTCAHGGVAVHHHHVMLWRLMASWRLIDNLCNRRCGSTADRSAGTWWVAAECISRSK